VGRDRGDAKPDGSGEDADEDGVLSGSAGAVGALACSGQGWRRRRRWVDQWM